MAKNAAPARVIVRSVHGYELDKLLPANSRWDGWTFQLELTRCGKCKTCKAGTACHGPYWYAYRRRQPKGTYGRPGPTQTVYIGKKPPWTEEADESDDSDD